MLPYLLSQISFHVDLSYQQVVIKPPPMGNITDSPLSDPSLLFREELNYGQSIFLLDLVNAPFSYQFHRDDRRRNANDPGEQSEYSEINYFPNRKEVFEQVQLLYRQLVLNKSPDFMFVSAFSGNCDLIKGLYKGIAGVRPKIIMLPVDWDNQKTSPSARSSFLTELIPLDITAFQCGFQETFLSLPEDYIYQGSQMLADNVNYAIFVRSDLSPYLPSPNPPISSKPIRSCTVSGPNRAIGNDETAYTFSGFASEEECRVACFQDTDCVYWSFSESWSYCWNWIHLKPNLITVETAWRGGSCKNEKSNQTSFPIFGFPRASEEGYSKFAFMQYRQGFCNETRCFCVPPYSGVACTERFQVEEDGIIEIAKDPIDWQGIFMRRNPVLVFTEKEQEIFRTENKQFWGFKQGIWIYPREVIEIVNSVIQGDTKITDFEIKWKNMQIDQI
jgi:hypothetical protein